MKYSIVIILFFCVKTTLYAQPYTLNKEIKAKQLTLQGNPKHPGAGYLEYYNTIPTDTVQYYYLKGHDMYQYVDIFIYAQEGHPNLKAALAVENWRDAIITKNTSSSEEGVINFKVRSFNDIGIKITTTDKHPVPFGIIINASTPIQNHLTSPFVKAIKENTAPNPSQAKEHDSTSSGIPWLYSIIGILVLLVGLLAGRWSKKNKTILLLITIVSFHPSLSSQTTIGEEIQQRTEEQLERERQRTELNKKRNQYIKDRIGSINKAFKTASALESLIGAYQNLDSCISTVPPANSPKIPSFCADKEGCAPCFRNAREKFNQIRYKLEKLQAIYNCTTTYTKSAIAFGDNASGYHGVVGIVWQSERRKIMKSIASLDTSYDKKRIELLNKLNNTLLELDVCERQYGLEDWYDRFGVLYYNFMELRYHRS